MHEGVNFQCNQCESKFTHQGILKRHKMSVHEGVKYLCNQCDSKFTRQDSLKKHKISVHQANRQER